MQANDAAPLAMQETGFGFHMRQACAEYQRLLGRCQELSASATPDWLPGRASGQAAAGVAAANTATNAAMNAVANAGGSQAATGESAEASAEERPFCAFYMSEARPSRVTSVVDPEPELQAPAAAAAAGARDPLINADVSALEPVMKKRRPEQNDLWEAQLRSLFREEDGQVQRNASRGSFSHVSAIKLQCMAAYAAENGDVRARACAVHPNSWVQFLLGLGVTVVCLSDLLLVPYEVSFDPPFGVWNQALALFSFAFWVTDMTCKFFTGFYEEGVLIMSECRIMKRYIRGWFTVDLVLLVVDLMAILLGDKAQLRRVFRALKVSRLLRVCAIVRRYRDQVGASFDSASLMIVGLCCRAVVLILLLNHVLSCIWFWIGDGGISDTGLSWLDLPVASENRAYRDYDPLFLYFTSLHWSMTQMTPGSMAVVPQNSLERAYNVVCLVIGLFVSALLLAQLSASIVRVNLMNQEQLRQAELLERFLRENNVPWALARRIELQSKERQKMNKFLTEQDVLALSWLSITLRQELAIAIFGEPVVTHTLFLAWEVSEPKSVEHLCVSALEFESHANGSDVFAPFLAAEKAYLVIAGALIYQTTEDEHADLASRISVTLQMHTDAKPNEIGLQRNAWVSTVALWLQWEYRGTLRASDTSKLMAIPAQQFCSVLQNYPVVLDMSRGYARAFGQLVLGDRTDCCPDIDVDPAQVLMGSPLPDRMKVMRPLFRCLRDGRRTSSGVSGRLAGIAVRHTARNICALEEEVGSGKCVLSVGPGAELCRTVLLVVLNIERPGGCVLVRVARQQHPGHVQPDVALPGVKLFEGETPRVAALRVLRTKLPTLKGLVELGEAEQVVETSHSRDYGITTMYKKTIYQAKLFHRLQLCAPSDEAVRVHTAPDGLTSVPLMRKFTRSSIDWLPTWKDHGGGRFAEVIHAWLHPDEYKRLSKASADDVSEWLAACNVPLEENADSSLMLSNASDSSSVAGAAAACATGGSSACATGGSAAGGAASAVAPAGAELTDGEANAVPLAEIYQVNC